MKNYYKIMGVAPNATDAEIKRVYRQKAKELHPDLNRDNPNAATQLADVNEAYEILSDTAKRAEYDKEYNAAIARRAAHQQAAQQAAQPNFGARPVPPQFNNPYAQYKAGFSTRFEAAAQAMANAQQWRAHKPVNSKCKSKIRLSKPTTTDTRKVIPTPAQRFRSLTTVTPPKGPRSI